MTESERCAYPPPLPKVGDFVWHVHHDILVEPLTEPFENRVEYIRRFKPEHEVETRLRLMRPVRETISPPKYWSEADAKRREAGAKRREADARWSEADAKGKKADAKRREADAKWSETYAKRREADAKWREADAKWSETYAKWREADARWREADAKWREAGAKWRTEPSWQKVLDLHATECPNCPWNGETIFP